MTLHAKIHQIRNLSRARSNLGIHIRHRNNSAVWTIFSFTLCCTQQRFLKFEIRKVYSKLQNSTQGPKKLASCSSVQCSYFIFIATRTMTYYYKHFVTNQPVQNIQAR